MPDTFLSWPELMCVKATAEHLPAVIALMDDKPGFRTSQRLIADDHIAEDGPDPASYAAAFAAIDADPNQVLLVGLHDDRVVGVLQLSFATSLVGGGSIRAWITSARLADDQKLAVGHQLIQSAVDYAQRRGACIVTLTGDKSRPHVHDLFRRIGFHDTHEGFTMTFASEDDNDSDD